MHCPASFKPIFSIFIVSSDIPGSEGNRGNKVPVENKGYINHYHNNRWCHHLVPKIRQAWGFLHFNFMKRLHRHPSVTSGWLAAKWYTTTLVTWNKVEQGENKEICKDKPKLVDQRPTWWKALHLYVDARRKSECRGINMPLSFTWV